MQGPATEPNAVELSVCASGAAELDVRPNTVSAAQARPGGRPWSSVRHTPDSRLMNVSKSGSYNFARGTPINLGSPDAGAFAIM